jgi:hypothetical protein
VNIEIKKQPGKENYFQIRATFELRLQKLKLSESGSYMTVFIDPTKIYSKENDPKTFVFGNELQSKLATWSIQI